MGQAFRRATGRLRSVDTPAPPSTSQNASASHRKQPVVPVDNVTADNIAPSSDVDSRVKADNVLEERDSEYDAMLSKMIGRIQTKPGGKLEMGEAFVVEKYNRPLPKLRNTTTESSRFEERPVPPGTLNVAQLRQVMLLYEGKAEDHVGRMDVQQIAEKFKVDVSQVQGIVQSLALLPEANSKHEKDP